jgi:hypothetical protein
MLHLRVILALFDIEGLFYCQDFFLLTCGLLGVAGKGVTDSTISSTYLSALDCFNTRLVDVDSFGKAMQVIGYVHNFVPGVVL